MKTNRFFFLLLFLFAATTVFAQTRGTIIRPATPSTNPMNPNGDGFVYKIQVPPGFSNDGYYVDEFELKMFGIPIVGAGEVTRDNTGKSCGITDLIPDRDGFSVYAHRDASNNLVFRFRIGDDNPSVEAYTILLDTDGLFGPGIDPNATAENPGFEIDITLIKRNNAGVLVYNIDGIQSCPTPFLSYPLASNFQIAVADEVTCGDPDYFYDFYVPFNAVAAAYNIANTTSIDINPLTGLRYAAVTNVSATCAMAGKISDISGVDNNDPKYVNCDACAFTDIINAQCPTAIVDLCVTCLGFNTGLPSKPTINEPIRAGQTVITGTSGAGTFLKLSIYQRTGGTDAAPVWSLTPREEKTVAVPVSAWSITLSTPLLAYDKIVARAQLTIDGSGCDSSNGITTSTSITVVQPNVAPVAQNQAVTVIEDTPKGIVIVATDADNNPVTYTIVSQPANGVLSGTAPNLVYTPNLNYFGPDSFTFTASDGVLTSNTATVTITVTPVNDLPVASSQTVTTPEDTPKVITLTATDVDGDALTYIIVTPPANGTLSGSGATRTYTPNANYNGPESFTFKVNDGTSDSNTATVSITVTPVNDAPVASNQSVTVPEDGSIVITLVGTDVDGNSLIYTVVSGPSNGTLTGSGAARTYIPNANYNGPDGFTFKVNDGTVDSNIATVSITVTPVNDAPVATNQSLTTPEDTALPITLSATDVDAGSTLTYTIVTPPTKGTLSVVAGAGVTYTPNPNFFGADSFTFKASDGTVDSDIATIFITVTPVNDIPVANSQSVTTNEDTSTPVNLTGSDADGDPLTFLIVTGPLHGTLSGTGPNRIYTPFVNYNGPDSFTFKVNDGTTDSNTATVSITVTPVNDAPVADSQNVTVIEDTPKAIVLTGSDVEGDALSFTITQLPVNGTLSGTAPNVIYTPNANYFGSDSFRFRVNDGLLNSPTVFVTIMVLPVNDASVSGNQSITAPEDTPVSIILFGSDIDGDAITFSIVTPPANGTLTGTGSNRTYTPNPNYHGPDSFTYMVNDGTVNSAIGTITITVTPVNDTPIAINKTVPYDLNTPVNFTLDALDVDGDALTWSIVSTPADGALSGTAPNLTYTPDPGFNLTNTMTFTVHDGTVVSNTGTITFVFNNNAINDPPVAEPQTIIVVEDQSKNLVLGASDPDPGDVLTYTIDTPPSHGTLTGTGANLIYTPAPNYFGPDSFIFRVTDVGGLFSTATVSITVTPVNDAPIAFNQTISTEYGTAINITLTGMDVDGNPLTYTIVSPLSPATGTLSGLPPNLTFFTLLQGVYTFTFKVNDGTVDSNIATIQINVTEDNDVPYANNKSITTIEDTAVSFSIDGGDDHGDPITYIIVTLPLHGTLSGTAPALTYTPNPNYTGPDSFTFKVNDGVFDSNIATVSITVTPVNDAPVANNQSVTVTQNIAKVITLTGMDVDNDPLTFTVRTLPAHGTLTGAGAVWTYTPDADYSGPDSFTFKVNDGLLDSNTGTVSINVIPVNKIPVAVDNLITTPEDTPVTFNITGNDIDLDGTINPATVDLDPSTPVEDKTVTVSGQGTYTVNASGNVTFTPVLNYNGTTTPVSYTVKDNAGALSNVATIQVIVTPVNDPPVVTPITVTINNEDEPTSICFTVTDIENDPSVFSGGISLDGHGTLIPDPLAGPFCFLYTPNPDYNGPDRVQVTICDANDLTLCTSGIINIIISPVNDPPVIVIGGNPVDKVFVTTPEDTPVNFCFDATDLEGDNIHVGSIVNTLGGGTIVPGAGGPNTFCFTFTPALNYNGKSIWTVSVCDDGNPSLCKEVTIEVTITPVQDAPVAVDQLVSVVEDTPKAITLEATDVDGDVLTYMIVTEPVNGTLSCNNCANPTYTPKLNYNGPDSFTFKVNDGITDSNVATVSITVTPVNDAPVISGIPVLTTPEDTELLICLGVSDVEGHIITYQTPVHITGGGTMTPKDVNCFLYMPAKDYNGPASWKFTVCDNGVPSLCTEVTVQITITPVNDPPIAVNDFIEAMSFVMTTPVNILANDRDIDNNGLVLTTTAVAGPFHGTVTMKADGTFEYKSNLGFIGADSVRYRVCDTGVPSLCDEGVVFIEVAPAPFKIYNGLSPNGDNLNDYWRIDGIEAYPNNRVRVFDRFNNLIFETTGYNNDNNSWRGQANHSMMNGSNMSEGTYFYSVDLGDGSELYSGYVVLKKN